MAGILNPKTRFFDTFITREGRRQLANGEIRTRFISFSDSLTAYEQSELGVIDTKDGAVFFEAMSRPQDAIVAENPSILNMMELRNPASQPAFLAKEVTGSDGTVTQTSLLDGSTFGKEVLSFPTGKQVLVVTSSGIDTKKVEYDPRSPFYVSGSRSQELFYDSAASGLKGWWIFDSTVTQLNEFTDPAFLNFERDILNHPAVSKINGVTGTATAPISLSEATTTIEFDQNVNFAPAIGDVIGFKDHATGERIAFSIASLPEQPSPIINVKYSPAFSVNLIQAAEGDVNSKRDARPHMIMLASAVNSMDFLSANVSQNLSSSSPLSTNAAYRFYDTSTNNSVIDSSPVFEANHLPAISDLGKSYKTRTSSFIHINLQEKHYNSGVNDLGEPLYGNDWGSGEGINLNNYQNQVSVWFYIQSEGFDSPSPNQTILQLFSGPTKKVVEIYAVNNTLKVKYFKDDGTAFLEEVSSDGIDPETWHRLSVVYGPAFTDDPENILHVTLDGDKRKSFRKTGTPQLLSTSGFSMKNMTDLILGANLDNLSSLPDEDQRLKGYIQECQYFIKPTYSNVVDQNTNPNVPALLTGSINDKYNDQISILRSSDFFNMTGMFPETAEDPADQAVDNLVRYRSSRPSHFNVAGGSHVTLSGSVIHVRDSLREWTNYNPIRNEAALFFAGKGTKTFVKEQQLEDGTKRATVEEVVDMAMTAMSGSLRAYRHLGLLQHLDLEVPVSGSAPLTIKRTKMMELETANPGQSQIARVEIPENETVKFHTRLKQFPFQEPIYGKSPNNYHSNKPRRIENTKGPASGRFLENAGTVYHIEEIIDNEIDNDELTFSSSRMPNYFLLPPIAADYFKFQHDGEIDSLEDMMSWREFLRRRSVRFDQDLEKARDGEISERWIGTDQTKERYLELMRTWYKSLVPDETMRELVKRFGTHPNQDSNQGLVQYLIRDVNIPGGGGRNNIEFPLERFNEVIEFENTSLLNNSFIQMFECAKEDGKATFTKLAIMDLGVKRYWGELDHGSVYRWRTTEDETRWKSGIVGDSFDRSDRRNRLQHVFAFGKLIQKKTNPNNPGTEIYFFPIFSLACDLEVD